MSLAQGFPNTFSATQQTQEVLKNTDNETKKIYTDINSLMSVGGHAHSGNGSDGGKITASNIINAATENISATTIQGAINQLDYNKTEKTSTIRDSITIRCNGYSETSHYSSYDYSKISNDYSIISGLYVSSWLSLVGNSITVQLPFGVVIGDSIARGSPALNSRLDPVVNLNLENYQGQFSYEFGEITGIHWYNQGIGSQLSADVWARWRRDVLGEVYDVGDGRGTTTLSGKAHAVFINVGVNDVGTNIPITTTQQNMINMAKSAQQNGILCIFNNIPPLNTATEGIKLNISTLNKWMKNTLPNYGSIVVDFNTWCDPTQTGSNTRSPFFADQVHPTKTGYQSASRYIMDAVSDLPIFLNGLLLESPIDVVSPPNSYSRPKTLNVTIGTKTKDSKIDDVDSSYVPILSIGETDKAVILINSMQLSTASFTGFSKVKALLGKRMSIIDNPLINDYYCNITNNSNITLLNATWTTLPFNTSLFNAIQMHNSSVNNSRVTIKASGNYLIKGEVSFPTNTTGIRGLQIKVNGATAINQKFVSTVTGVSTMVEISKIFYLSTGQYVELQAYQTSSADMILGYTQFLSPQFSVIKL